MRFTTRYRMLSDINISQEQYVTNKPFPYYVQDSFLKNYDAQIVQQEIVNIPDCEWDRYDNPFEQKYTLRNKYTFPTHLNKLFEEFQSEEFVNRLSELCGYPLILDTTRNFWGVHKYKANDKLDIHVDAGLHPGNGLKKQLTLGLYLSSNWKKEYNCELEIWKGDNASRDDAKLYEKVDSIAPLFNRLLLFTNNDYSWHGNPEPATCDEDSSRIFITISYLSKQFRDENKRVKAFFIKRPSEPDDPEKDRLRRLRADPIKYKECYRSKPMNAEDK